MGIFDKFDATRALHNQVKSAGRDPFGVSFDEVHSPTAATLGGRAVTLFGTNNYLGLTFDADCLHAGAAALAELGTGTTGSRIANGTYAAHVGLERQIADFFGKSDAMVFSTGYQANLGLISTLGGKGDVLLIDADSHASIYDACRLGHAEVIRFRHNSPEDLDKRLGRLKDHEGSKIVVTEGVYSMLGDSAPLREFVEVKNRHGACLVVDEAHSLGVHGPNGRGLAEAEGVLDEVDFVVGTFSKSLGAVGGFAASSVPGMEIMRVVCRPYMFTASLPPVSIATVSSALQRVSDDPSLGTRARENGHRLYRGLSRVGFDVGPQPNPVVAVRLSDPALAAMFWNKLLEAGYYVNLALPPATPAGVALVRASVCAAHTPAQIDGLIAAMVDTARALCMDVGAPEALRIPAE